MKKFLSIMLALMMLASAASVAVSAEVVFSDDFEADELDYNFWFDIGKYVISESDSDPDNMVMSGFSDAKFALTRYQGIDGSEGVFDPDVWGTFKEMTIWVDINVIDDSIAENFGAGFWVIDTYEMAQGLVDKRTEYKVLYYAQYGEEEMATARLFSDNPRREPDYPDHIYGKLALPEVGVEKELENGEKEFVSGFNMGGESLRLGMRYGRGNVTAYANGKIIASYNSNTIGLHGTPIILENNNCYVEFDNFAVGTYDENVKLRTRNDSYVLAEADVSVSNGATATTEKHTEDETVTVTAPAAAEAGKSFDKWTMKIGGRAVEDVETAELLHGIEIGDLSSKELTFTMPNENVELVATYKDAVPHAITVTDGTADPAQAVVGTTVTVTANEAPAGKTFDKWEVVNGAVTFADETKATTTFVMDDADVEIRALYKDGVAYTAGDANGDGKINAKDIIMTMRYMLSPSKPPAGFIFEAADMDASGKINAKDIIAIMRKMLEKK